MALVDSGADYSVFPIEIATDDLKLDLSDAPIWRFSGTDGNLQEARLAEVAIAILEENDYGHAFNLTATCAFCIDFKFGGGCLLGQDGFFSEFRICFDRPKNAFEITRAEREEARK